jgi:hypothetical protein
MLNFLLGTVAGALIAAVLTISAARQPEIQSRLGLAAALPLTPAAARPVDQPQCRPTASAAQTAKAQDILFNRQRFWSVTP